LGVDHIHTARGWELLQQLGYRSYVPRPRHRKCYYQISSHPHPYHLHLHSSNAGKTASKVVWGRGHLYGGEAIPLTIHR
jgi:hypothetical protein